MTDTNAGNLTIEAKGRTGKGKSFVRKLRRAGRLPGVLLNNGKSIEIDLDPKNLSKVWQSEAKTCSLSLNGATHSVKIQELHVESVSRAALHVDFLVTK